MKKDIVAGLGEIGEPIYKLLSKNYDVVGYDLNHNLMNQTKFKKFQSIKTSFLHITIPVNKNFNSNVLLAIRYANSMIPTTATVISNVSLI